MFDLFAYRSNFDVIVFNNLILFLVFGITDLNV